MTIQDLNVKSYIKDALKALNFSELTPIQQDVIPHATCGEDIIGQSQTGSGKTHAFLIPIFNGLDEAEKSVQAVITAPTRELAEQIYQMAIQIAAFSETEIQVVRYIGGRDRDRDLARLSSGQPHIVIGTPGRIRDLAIDKRALLVHTAITFIVDEADMTLEAGFLTDIDQIAGTMNEDLQMMVFSATIPAGLKPFLRKYMHAPKHIHISPRQATAAKIEHILYPTRHRNRVEILRQLLPALNPYLAVIFTNTREQATEVAAALASSGIEVGQIHGGLEPRQRRQMMSRIRKLDFQYIVATDIAARGIDIEGISHVINYALPADLEFYIHRTGRTARGKMSGVAITLFDTGEEDALTDLEGRGIEFSYQELSADGILVEAQKQRNRRTTRKHHENEFDLIAKAKVRKPKRVSPGYKKKLAAERERVAKQARRQAYSRTGRKK